MQFFALNGGTLNGTSGVPTVAASANVVASASFTAVARNNGAMLADVGTQGGFTAVAMVYAAGVANVTAGATVNPGITFRQAARAEIVGTAEANFFVVRNVMVAAHPKGTAEILAFPEGKLANASVSTTANVSATARRIQPGRAEGGASAELVASARVLRMARATVDPSVSLRVEAQRNKQVDAFADLVVAAQVSTPNAGIVLRMVDAMVDVTSAFTPVAARIQPGRANAMGLSSEVIGEPLVFTTATFAPITGTAAVNADATRVVMPEATATGAVVIELRARQAHSAAAVASVGSDANANGTRRANAQAAVLGAADLTAVGGRQRLADATFSVSADAVAVGQINIPSVGQLLVGTSTINAWASVVKFGNVAIGAGSDITAEGERRRSADAQVDGSASLDAAGLRTAYVIASLSVAGECTAAPYVRRNGKSAPSGSAEVDASAVSYSVLRFADSSLSAGAEIVALAHNRAGAVAGITGSSLVTADAFTNMAAMDPPERTMVRPFVDRAMSRPFIDREMRRAA